MTKAHVLKVFTDTDGKFGDEATVIIDEGRRISDSDRQELTRKLDTGETVFINDLANADISIMHPQGEIDFAGVAALGAAWLIGKFRDTPVTVMKGRGGAIIVSQSDDLVWVRTNLATMPAWQHKQLESSEVVERITLKETEGWKPTMAWAWVDEVNGLIRARTFAADWDIPEAEGNGSGSMMLAAILNREIKIRHGKGALIFAKPAPDNSADIGGQVSQEHDIEV